MKCRYQCISISKVWNNFKKDWKISIDLVFYGITNGSPNSNFVLKFLGIMKNKCTVSITQTLQNVLIIFTAMIWMKCHKFYFSVHFTVFSFKVLARYNSIASINNFQKNYLLSNMIDPKMFCTESYKHMTQVGHYIQKENVLK